ETGFALQRGRRFGMRICELSAQMKTRSSSFRAVCLCVLIQTLWQTAHGQSVWNATNGIALGTNWSTAANWSPSGVPGAVTNVKFFDNAAVSPGITNNVVDSSLTVASVQYGQTNGSHTTLILPGLILTITNGLTAGTETTNATIVGGAA